MSSIINRIRGIYYLIQLSIWYPMFDTQDKQDHLTILEDKLTQ